MKNENELIAEFMGLPFSARVESHIGNHGVHVLGMRYHESWDWLMPVVEKIEQLGFKTVASQNEWNGNQYINIITGVGIITETVDNPSKFMASDKAKIKAWYAAVVQFIKWYNSQQV